MSERVPLEPARLAHSADGIPCSLAYGDVYHSAGGGYGQARHVFLAGNDLPQRWRGRPSFSILETGFGQGLNFLATWAAWRDDPQRPGRLHFFSLEKHPFPADDLAVLHVDWPELADLSRELRARWPVLVPGFHRLHFEGGRISLTLAFGDARDTLPQIEGRFDAFYLDGFAPSRNPELWAPELLGMAARLGAEGATAATWSVAGTVRRALLQCGFAVEKRPGYAGKREMLTARLPQGTATPAGAQPQEAIVIGAGLAGSACAERLAARGWCVTVIDRRDGPGRETSGNLTGALLPVLSLDDNRLSRLARAAFLYALRHLHALSEAGLKLPWQACGVLHLARDAVHLENQRRVVERRRFPVDFVRWVYPDEGSRLVGQPVAGGGWWFPAGAWASPADLCAANLARHADRIRSLFGTTAASLQQTGEGWIVRDESGARIAAAPVLILANGLDVKRFEQSSHLPLRCFRGQVTHLPQHTLPPLHAVVCREGYVTPAHNGVFCVGASFHASTLAGLRSSDHDDNLKRLARMLPSFPAPEESAGMTGRVGFRPVSPDKLPMAGALTRADAPRVSSVSELPRWPNLYVAAGYGARGIIWSALTAELLASRLSGEPSPLEAELCAAMDPGRFILRAQRRPGLPYALAGWGVPDET